MIYSLTIITIINKISLYDDASCDIIYRLTTQTLKYTQSNSIVIAHNGKTVGVVPAIFTTLHDDILCLLEYTLRGRWRPACFWSLLGRSRIGSDSDRGGVPVSFKMFKKPMGFFIQDFIPALQRYRFN